jgi:signal transduction histidine kinase
MKMDIAWLGKKISLEEEQVRSKLRQMTELVDGTVKTVRRISSELRPSLLDDLGLVAAMDWHLKEFENRSGIKACLEESLQDLQVSEAVKTGLFRIFQESLTNVARHARASHVIVKLQQKGINIEMSIEDDGEGFNKLQVDQKRTLGILGMKERSMMMGGRYEISSIPGRGTRVRVSVPDVNLT